MCVLQRQSSVTAKYCFSEKMEDLTEHVPSLYLHSIACHCKVKGIAIQSSSDIIVACTPEGVVIEFSDQQILNTYEIDNCKPEDVKFFVCYKPFCMYYCVKSVTDVFILAREEDLRVSHVFNEVEKMMIDDFWKVGSPQIGLWYDKSLTEEPHFITDLSSSKTEVPATSNEFTLLYYERLKETKMKCAQLKQNLEAKQSLRYKYTQELIKNQLDEDIHCQLTKHLHLVYVFGDKITNKRKSERLVSAQLELQKIWQRVHNDKWIIGVQVVNKGKIPIVSLDLFLKDKDGSSVTCRTYFYTRKKPCDEANETESCRSFVTEWKSPDVLHRDILVTGVAALSLPSFWPERKHIICGVITYHVDEESSHQVYQLPVPYIEITLEEFVKNSLSPFNIECKDSEEDYLSILVSSFCMQLSVTESIANILIEKFGFSSLSEYGRYYSGSNALPYLAGILVESWHKRSHDQSLVIHAKNSSQALSLVQCLHSAMSHGVHIAPAIKKTSPNLQKKYKALEAEVNFTATQLAKWEEMLHSPEGIICVPKKEYFQFRTLLFNLEKESEEIDPF